MSAWDMHPEVSRTTPIRAHEVFFSGGRSERDRRKDVDRLLESGPTENRIHRRSGAAPTLMRARRGVSGDLVIPPLRTKRPAGPSLSEQINGPSLATATHK